jgi:hypothetical protein
MTGSPATVSQSRSAHAVAVVGVLDVGAGGGAVQGGEAVGLVVAVGGGGGWSGGVLACAVADRVVGERLRGRGGRGVLGLGELVCGVVDERAVGCRAGDARQAVGDVVGVAVGLGARAAAGAGLRELVQGVVGERLRRGRRRRVARLRGELPVGVAGRGEVNDRRAPGPRVGAPGLAVGVVVGDRGARLVGVALGGLVAVGVVIELGAVAQPVGDSADAPGVVVRGGDRWVADRLPGVVAATRPAG